ncbi:MAG: hypothetical protein ACOVLC_01715 [Flavobacterium sp.]
MKKIIFLFLWIFTFYACQTKYSGEEKIRFIIKTNDVNSEPIEGIDVTVVNKFGRFSETIAKGKTKSDGLLQLIFPRLEKDTIDYDIKIDDPKAIFATCNVINISYFDLSEHQLVLPTTTLPKINELCNLLIRKNQTNTNRFLKSAQLDGLKFDSLIDYSYENYDTDVEFPEYKVFKNQVATLNYSVIDYNTEPPTTEQFSVQIPINNESSILYTIFL